MGWNIFKLYLPIILAAVAMLLGDRSGIAPVRPPATSTPTPIATPLNYPATPMAAPTPDAGAANGSENSTVAAARARLQQEGMTTTLIIVTGASTGVEGIIYQDLLARGFRSTTGPDEGIDTHSLSCYPNCIFVPAAEVDALGVDLWVQVLRHEYRHMVQASHNPNMASVFRNSDGWFTSYAAFSEVCADFGLNVAPLYQAELRMLQLRSVVGAAQQPLIDQACQGDKLSYDKLLQAYNSASGSDQAFAQLFPPYS
jgi:hypothetical protein